jgi:ribosomal protein S7
VSHRALVIWDGFNEALYEKSALEAYKYGLSNADLRLLAIDQHATPQIQQWPEAKDKLQTFKAAPGPNGLDGIAETLKADYKKFILANPSAAPSAYEIIFYVTNHGHLDETNRSLRMNRDPYSITGDDSAATIPHLYKQDLERFAKNLPSGIRFKMVFGQCYGADTQGFLLNAVSDETCACGVSLSAPGQPSFNTSTPYLVSWERRVLSQSKVSLLEAQRNSQFGPDAQKGEIGKLSVVTVRPEDKDEGEYQNPDAQNWPHGTSELFVLQSLATIPAIARYIDVQNGESLNPENFEAFSEDLLKLAGDQNSAVGAGTLSTESQKDIAYVLKQSNISPTGNQANDYKLALRATASTRTSLRNSWKPVFEIEKLSNRLNRLEGEHPPDPKKIAQAESLLERTIQSALENRKTSPLFKYGKRIREIDPKKETLARIVSRVQLAQAFDRVATEKQKKQYLALRQCENESLSAPRQNPFNESPAAAETTSH